MTGHAIVTGSSGGIGAAVCRLLHDSGWGVSGFDIVTPARSPWDHVFVDLAVPGDMATAVALARDKHGPVSALVHCAAVQTLGGVGTVAVESWQRTFQVNVVALDELAGACRDDLIAGRGAIVAISSVHAVATTPGIAAYATSKAALNGWVRAAALDLAPAVRVNAVQPGAVRTNMLVDGLARRPHEPSDNALAILADRTPLRRVAAPDEIAALVEVLLDSAQTGFVTGTVITADGGALAHLSTE